MKALCVFCTKKKDESSKLLPASKRYIGSSVKKAIKRAEELNLPLYFMSGKYGFITAAQEIPNYDKLLLENEVEGASDNVADQMRAENVSNLLLYAKPKEGILIPYHNVVEIACNKSGVTLEKETIK